MVGVEGYPRMRLSEGEGGRLYEGLVRLSGWHGHQGACSKAKPQRSHSHTFSPYRHRIHE